MFLIKEKNINVHWNNEIKKLTLFGQGKPMYEVMCDFWEPAFKELLIVRFENFSLRNYCASWFLKQKICLQFVNFSMDDFSFKDLKHDVVQLRANGIFNATVQEASIMKSDFEGEENTMRFHALFFGGPASSADVLHNFLYNTLGT